MGADGEEETQVITMRASRFNERYTEQMLRRVGEQYGLRLWVRKREEGWFKREFTITARGEPDRIAELVEALDAPRPVLGDGGGGF